VSESKTICCYELEIEISRIRSPKQNRVFTCSQPRFSSPLKMRSLFISSSKRSFSSAFLPESAKKASNLLVWGQVDQFRLGMRLPEAAASKNSTQVDSPMLHAGSSSPPSPSGLFGLHGGVAQVVCRANKTLLLTRDGTVYSWGTCDNLSLGHGDDVTRVFGPRKIEALSGIRIVQVDAGDTSCAAVSEEGEVFTWGWGGSFWSGNGGLGHGNSATQTRPALVEGLWERSSAAVKVASVSVGSAHMLALTKDGRVFSWGNGEYGRLGNGKNEQLVPEPVTLLDDVASSSSSSSSSSSTSPARSSRVIQISAGQAHSLAVLGDGRLFAWGKNEASQLGLGGAMVMDLNTMEAYPTLVELDSSSSGDDVNDGNAKRFNGRVAKAVCGQSHTLALTNDGSVWQWGGRNFLQPTRVDFGAVDTASASAASEGRKETPSSSSSSSKTAVPNGMVSLKGVELAAGDGSSAVIDADGRLFTWGKLMSGSVLGHEHGGLAPRLGGVRHPTIVKQLAVSKIPISSISLGTAHAGAVTGIPASL
jgi:E3 ubiquitin-protein ligase HERC2